MKTEKNYLTRKKILMGKEFVQEIPLEQYGGAVVRIHAIPDLELARIEQQFNFSTAKAIDLLTGNLTEADLKLIESAEGDKEALIKPEMVGVVTKAAKSLTPELMAYLGELCKKAILPPPDCTCKGKGCDECDIASMVEDFVGASIVTVGMAVMNASSTSWKEIEDFFSRKTP